MTNWKLDAANAYSIERAAAEHQRRERIARVLEDIAAQLARCGVPTSEMTMDVDSEVVQVDHYAFIRQYGNPVIVRRRATCGAWVRASDGIYDAASLGKALVEYDEYIDSAHFCETPEADPVEENVALVMNFVRDMLIDRGWHVDSAYGRVDLNTIETFARSYYSEAING